MVNLPSAAKPQHPWSEFHARYWYDGNYVHNAKEDAAEMAYNYVRGCSSPARSSGSSSGGGGGGGPAWR